jgi:hypothetical protein
MTEHAKARPAEYSIPDEWLERVVEAPSQVEGDDADPTITIASAPIHEFGERTLRVVYNHEHNPLLIVTLYFDRRGKGGK